MKKLELPKGSKQKPPPLNRFLNKLAELRSFPDDLPKEEVRPWNHLNYPLMKCRHGAVTAIRSSLDALSRSGLLKDENVNKKISDFLNYKFKDWTTPEEIKLINEVLDTTINYLCSTYNVDAPKIDYDALLQVQRENMGPEPGKLGPRKFSH